VAFASAWLIDRAPASVGGSSLPSPESVHLLSALPLWTQSLLFLVIEDFFEWCVHNLLHRVPWLWEFHKLHHSILELDWIGNFRFGWKSSSTGD